MIFDEESASDAQTIVAPPKNLFIDFTQFFFEKKSPKHIFRRPNMKCRESSETRFGKVSRQSEPCSRGKRPFEISKKFSKTPSRILLDLDGLGYGILVKRRILV